MIMFAFSSSLSLSEMEPGAFLRPKKCIIRYVYKYLHKFDDWHTVSYVDELAVRQHCANLLLARVGLDPSQTNSIL